MNNNHILNYENRQPDLLLLYAKKVLSDASSRKSLFKKQLINSIRYMDEHERFECYKWCRIKFYDRYPEVLEEVFPDIFKAVRFIA